jgi:tRNA pseudouridine13 synthase
LTPAAETERAVGIEGYATNGDPCYGRARSSADDFVVEEQLLEREIAKEERPDYLPIYRVEKRGIDTLHMADDLAHFLKSKVSYCGLKDKRAVAIQYVTPTSRRSSRPARVVRENYIASLVGYVDRPVSRAAMAGNGFILVLRDCCPEIESRVEEAMRLAEERSVPNFYGLQRFGTSKAGTHLIGRAIVKREFEDAVRLILQTPPPTVEAEGLAAREAKVAGRHAEGISLLQAGKDVERKVAKELIRHPDEWVMALRRVPLGLRRLYVQAYESYIFNMTLSRALAEGHDISRLQTGDNWAETTENGLVTSAPRGVRDTPTEKAVPMVQLVGYAYRDYGSRFDAIISDILEAEGVSPQSFYLKEMQEVSVEGGFRRPHLALRDASWSVEGPTARLKFTLAKGQYATVLLREILKPRDPKASGLA